MELCCTVEAYTYLCVQYNFGEFNVLTLLSFDDTNVLEMKINIPATYAIYGHGSSLLHIIINIICSQ